MRILQVTQWYPPIVGGVEMHVRHLSAALAERGHSVSVATLLQKGLEPEAADGSVRVHRLQGLVQRVPGLFFNEHRRSAAPIVDPELLVSLQRVIAAERPDVVHAHNWLVFSLLPLGFVRHMPLVVTLHDYGLVCARQDLMRWGHTNCDGPGLERCLRCAGHHYGAAKGIATVLGHRVMTAVERGRVDRFIAVSRSVAVNNGLTDRGEACVVIPNFLPDAVADDQTPHDDAPGLPDEPFLLYVGAISRVKGVPVLLRAYAGLDNPPPLVLIGYPGADTEAILKGLPRGVTFLESKQHEFVVNAWRRSLIGLVPSVCQDACPTVVMEAMAAGTPVIASNIGGIPDLVEDGRSGLLVQPGSVDELRSAISRLIEDPALAQRLSDGGRRAARTLSVRSVVPRIEQVYRDVSDRARLEG